ncbi:MAG: PEP-CTERM sorting domain-containing protein [Planctomycetaceae bacterium]|nr:PEP-CTERM sorting domain-containing protein [Planctomycetaceae bacterium]
MNRLLTSIILLAGLGGLAVPGQAAIFTMADANSTATVDATGGTGMYEWKVDGVDHLAMQWFWYRIGDSGPESSVSALPFTGGGLTDTNFDGSAETLYLRYASTQVKVELTFLLTGGAAGSGTSDIAEVIGITNTSGAPLSMHFFQYVDINLNASSVNDSLKVVSGNTAIQTLGGSWVAETVVTPRPSLCQADLTAAVLDSLEDAAATTLSGATGSVGPGDLAWAYQWDVVIPKRGTYFISKDKQLIPEPASLGLLLTGAATLVIRRRRRSSGAWQSRV